MTSTTRLVAAVAMAGLALTGCAAGLTSGGRGAAPASVAAADSGSPMELPTTASPTTSESVATTGVPMEGDSESGNSADAQPSAVSVGPDRVTAPGVSVGPDGVTAPGVSVGPDGVVVDDSSVDAEVAGTDSDSGAPYVSRACADGEDVTVADNGSTVVLTGACGSVTVLADGAYVTLESGGAILVTGGNNTVVTGSADSIEITGNGNYLTYATTVTAPLDSGTGNTLIG